MTTSTTAQPTLETVLPILTRERLYDLGRVVGARIRQSSAPKTEIAASLAGVLGNRRLPEVLRELGREELRAICRAHGFEDDTRQRETLLDRILIGAGFDPKASIPPPLATRDGLPKEGQVLTARGRQWLVEEVAEGGDKQSPLLRLACFLVKNWPFSSPPPSIYCDRRALRPGKGADYCSLHAKCVSVDSRRAFVSSANFTLRGQDRNIETGVLLDDPSFAQQLDRQWMSLVDGGFVLKAK